MNHITSWYEFVLAQMAADSYLDDPSETDDQALPFDFANEDSLILRLRNGANRYDTIQDQEENGETLSATRMTLAMANDFVSTWEVIDHLPNTSSGFSATVLKHKITGKYTLSFRSTESKDAIKGGDVERDSFNGANGQLALDGFAWGQLRDMENYYQQLKSGVLATGSAADGAAIAASLAADPINVTGYSLGAHLAQAFTLMGFFSVSTGCRVKVVAGGGNCRTGSRFSHVLQGTAALPPKQVETQVIENSKHLIGGRYWDRASDPCRVKSERGTIKTIT